MYRETLDNVIGEREGGRDFVTEHGISVEDFAEMCQDLVMKVILYKPPCFKVKRMCIAYK